MALCINCFVQNELKIEVAIDLTKIKINLASARETLAKIGKSKAEICLMLKADAYGHGLEEVAKSTAECVDGFGAMTLNEAVRIRKIAPKIPILVNMLTQNEIEEAVENGLTIGLSNDEQLDAVKRYAYLNPKLHLAVDSGMHRFGFDVSRAGQIARELKECGLELCGVYSHFGDHAERQTERFEIACKSVREVFGQAKRHIASSHTFQNPACVFDGVRIGLEVYKGAMTVKSQVIATRKVEAGEYVGYGDHITQKPTNIAVVFGGYADGVQRNYPFVKWQGKRFEVICVCMDAVIVNTKDECLKIGDEVTFLDGETADKIAEKMHTIPYTLMTAWKGRINKIYV